MVDGHNIAVQGGVGVGVKVNAPSGLVERLPDTDVAVAQGSSVVAVHFSTITVLLFNVNVSIVVENLAAIGVLVQTVFPPVLVSQGEGLGGVRSAGGIARLGLSQSSTTSG